MDLYLLRLPVYSDENPCFDVAHRLADSVVEDLYGPGDCAALVKKGVKLTLCNLYAPKSAKDPAPRVDDFIYSGFHFLVASETARAVLARFLPDLVTVPTTIVNKAKAEVATGHRLVHLRRPQACLDPRSFGHYYGPVDARSARLACFVPMIDTSKIDASVAAFRVLGTTAILVRPDLADALRGLTGIELIPMSSLTGEVRDDGFHLADGRTVAFTDRDAYPPAVPEFMTTTHFAGAPGRPRP